MDFLEELNASQREAVTYTEGASLIVAGAGSGKTRVLTYRIAYLLRQGVPAHRIMALTFTNKAAREMKERIARLVSADEARRLVMGTFHSVCGKLLRPEAEKLGYTKDFTIYDTTDSKSLIKSICKELELDEKIYKPSGILGRISMLKNKFISVDRYEQDLDLQKEDNLARRYEFYDVYRLYQLRLKANNAMDFDDMLLETLRLMRQFSDVRERIQQQYQYILVDEYQDTNKVQSILVKELAAPQNNICVVGDDAQSIYSFRGADIGNILSFQAQYPDTQLFRLERNYRSTQNIVNASNSLISKNADRLLKEVYSEKEAGSQLILRSYTTDKEEAYGVVEQIAQAHSKQSTPYNNFVILYRTNAQSRLFEDELRKQNIAYRVYGNVSFYQRKEIKDVVSYLRIAVNPLDNEALLRAVGIYSGIGGVTMKKVAICANDNNVSYLELMQHPSIYGINGGGTISKLQTFAQKIGNLAFNATQTAASEFVSQALEVAGISLEEDSLDSEEKDRIQNIHSFVRQIIDFENEKKEGENSIVTIHEFLNEVSLLTDQDEKQNENTDSVTLMTIHSAKGLEFPTVFITGLEDGVFPSKQSIEKTKELEEERRLFYVAITRAMDKCYLCYAKQRFVNGEFKIQRKSMFLDDIDKQYISTLYYSSVEPNKTHWSFSIPSRVAFSDKSFSPATKTPSYNTPSYAAPDIPAAKAPVSGATSDIASSVWKTGDRVRHRVFGDGTVQRVYCDEVTENDKIEVAFDQKGVKTILLTYAKFDRI